MKTYNCPECGANVPLSDMNIAADVALCRACGTSSRIAELRESGDDAADYKALSGPTPKHVNVIRGLNDPSGKVELRYWKFSPVDDQADMQPKGGVSNFIIRVKNGNLGKKVCAYWDEDALDYALAMMKRYRA